MVELVGKVVWYRIREATTTWSQRFDALWMESDDETMDPLGMLLLGWIALAGLVYFTIDHLKHWLVKLFGEEPRQPQLTNRNVPADLPLSRESPYRCRTPESSSPSTSALSTPTESLQARVKLINYSQEGSDWVNNVLNWLYHRYNSTPEFADIWLSALNEYAKRNAQQLGILVTFDRFSPSSRPPRINDVRAELSADEQLSIFCSVETVQLGYHVLATTHTAERGVVTDNFDVDVDHIQGEVRFLNINDMRHIPPGQLHNRQCFQLAMKIYQNAQKDIIMAGEFERQSTPSIKVTARPVPGSEAAANEEFDPVPLQDVIKQCILNTKTSMKLARFRDFPYPYWHALGSKPPTPSSPTPSEIQPILKPESSSFPFIASGAESEPTTSRTTSPFGPGDNQVVVKVNRAQGIGGESAGMEPYCVIEMDEPPQKHTTSIVKSRGANPVWDETFLFDVSPDSNEILFELYDRTKTQKRNFLGTAIVSLHELSKNPHQRQVIPLQSRPMMNDTVSGTLTVEFSVIPAGGRKSPSTHDLGAQVSPTKTHVRMGMSPSRASHVYLHETVETHSPTERAHAPPVQRSVSEDVSLHRVTTVTNNGPQPPKRKSSATDGMLGIDGASYGSDLDAKGRSRSADRKQSLLGRIKRRFSFGKKRSKSLDPATAKAEIAAAAQGSSLSVNGPHVDRTTEPMDRDPEVLAAEQRAEKQERKNRKKGHVRSVSAPGSRDPSSSRAAAASYKAPTWKDKLRSRFSRKKSHDEPRIIRTQELQDL